MTAGVAIVGASVIAVTPIAPPPPASLRAADLAALSFSDIPTPNELIAALLESAPAGVAELLPSAAPGGAIGGVVSDVTEFIVALSAATGQSVATIALALGNLPGGILALTQAVIDDPTLLPNALSSLIHGGVDTLEAALAPIAGCSQPCPRPIGFTSPANPGLVVGASLALANVVDDLLGLLPPPLLPAPLTCGERRGPILDAIHT